MNKPINEILMQDNFTKDDLVYLLQTNKEDRNKIFTHAAKIKADYVGKKVYYRGLIEMSNICSKNCYYCGIRMDNKNAERYDISDQEILDAVKYA
ncbi:MAG: [FeFe] hydrogenase H-cluster radical SAM maturase HydE, partial [Bacteroidales bacterium]